jgi:hypothetical protein
MHDIPIMTKANSHLNDSAIYKQSLENHVNSGKSFKIGNFYCGLNFDFSTGAHHDYTHQNKIFPIANTNKVINRACLIDERGFFTQKFIISHELLKNNGRKTNYPLQTGKQTDTLELKQLDFPELKRIQISHILSFEKLVTHLNEPIFLKGRQEFLNIEFLSIEFKLESLNNGYVLYRLLNATLKEGNQIFIRPGLIKDYAIIICDFTKHVITIDPILNQYKLNETLVVNLRFSCKDIYVLVEVVGRLSDLNDVRSFYEQRKGLMSSDAIFFKAQRTKDRILRPREWIVNFLDFQPVSLNRVISNSDYVDIRRNDSSNYNLMLKKGPFCAFAKFIITKKSNDDNLSRTSNSIYFLLNNFRKGVVFLNGFNLGRYWNIGKILTLYVPENYIYDGVNELTVFELINIKANNLAIYIVDRNVNK